MAKSSNGRPHIPKSVQEHLWLRAGGRCEFRGCNKILFEDNVTQDPINGSNIAHIISWTETGPRGDKELSPRLATDISNLMLTCPEHNHLIDTGENVEKYTVSVLQEMKKEHERSIRELTGLLTQLPKRVIELKSMIHGQRPNITEKEEAEALFPFYPKSERISMHDELNELNTMLQSLAGFVGVEPPSPTDKPVNCLPEDLMQMAEQLDADLACINRACDVLGVCISLNA